MADAEAAVQSLLENIKQLLLYNANLIIGARQEVERLEQNLSLFKAFLKDSTKKRRKDDSLKELVRQIRDVVYEADHIIDAFVTDAAESKAKNYFHRSFHTPAKHLSIAKEVEKVGAKVRDIYGDKEFDFATLTVGDQSEAPVARQDNVVGFEDEAEALIGYLMQETQQLDIITIVGACGLGKTTLAGKIFHHPSIEGEFPTRIWVNVSQEFTKNDVCLTILRGLDMLTEDVHDKSDSKLAQLVAGHLERKRFLIVMDDVWKPKDWDKLKIFLPKNNKIGKVLITSRNEEVAVNANRTRPPHVLRFLTPEESWLLLQLEVFGKPDECPPELEFLGKLVVEECAGLPLAIVVIGQILAKENKSSLDGGARRTAWRKVCENVHLYLEERFYKMLPHHLRPCVLYLGMFPEGYVIPVSKLIHMWIAEGFIQPNERISLEETAENYLQDLIERRLVRIEKIKLDGKVKTCSISSMLHDFCKTEAGYEKENFLQEISESEDGVFEPRASEIKKYRRLCLHSNISNFISSKPFGPGVRSFICFSKDDIDLTKENCSAILAAFKLLRVFDVNHIKFTKIPRDLYQLVHLKYIALSFHLAILPADFSKLWNIQTLIVDTTSPTLEIKANIWKLIQLRCLKTNASTTLSKRGKTGQEAEKLQTLGKISPENCTEEVFDKTPNLKKLGICGRLSVLLDGKTGSFDSLGTLSHLKKLKLANDPLAGQLRGLPLPYKFPPKLKSLTLTDTSLDWSHMSTLGLLENLEVLKLKHKAFTGRKWTAADGGFRKLEVLHIGHTNLVDWEASGHHFPRMRRLELRNCEELQEVPIGLADIPSLQQLDLYCTKSAVASAKKIHEKKQKQREDQTTEVTALKLSISPPDE